MTKILVSVSMLVILEFMNEIFSSLCELYADVDVEVKEISYITLQVVSLTV